MAESTPRIRRLLADKLGDCRDFDVDDSAVHFFAGLWGLAYGVSAAIGFDYTESVSLAFTVASNNFELAIAVAVAVFGIGSNVVLATVLGPLIEVPVMLALVRVALATKGRLFADQTAGRSPAYSD